MSGGGLVACTNGGCGPVAHETGQSEWLLLAHRLRGRKGGARSRCEQVAWVQRTLGRVLEDGVIRFMRLAGQEGPRGCHAGPRVREGI
jgi:hypothetical protein